jgi:hypothetical protein
MLIMAHPYSRNRYRYRGRIPCFLADFGPDTDLDPDSYIIPLAHPRQIARLGAHSAHWAALHASWQTAPPPHLPSLQNH